MVSARVRREQVAFVVGRGRSHRQACALLSVARSTMTYRSRLTERDAPVLAALRELAGQAEQAYAFFNNNATSPDGQGGRMAQAAANAKELQRLLQAANVPVS